MPLFLVCIALAGLDQIFKKLVLHFHLKTGSFLGFAMDIFPNEHFILSLEITTNAFFKTIIITPVFVYVVFLYFLSIRYIPKSLQIIQFGWTMAVSGAVSNMADKLRLGYVLDIFSFQWKDFYLYFNFADIVQLIGWALLLSGAFKKRKEIWRIFEKRKTLIALKKEQWRFITSVMWVAFCFGLFFFIINSQFLLQYRETEEMLQEGLLLFALKYFGIAIALFLLPVLVIFVYISNKIFGPVYAFERHIRALIQGENPPDFQLRKGDHLQRLKTLARDIDPLLRSQKNKPKRTKNGE